MRIPFFRGAAAALLLLTGTAAALPVPACAKADNVEVQVEYGVPRYFENRHIRDVNVSIFQEAAKHGSLSWHRGLVVSASRGHTTEDGRYGKSNANGIGPAVMVRWERPWTGKLHWAVEGRGALLLYDKAFPANGRAYGFKWHIGPRAIYTYNNHDSISAGVFMSHSSNGLRTHNPGYNTVAWSLGWDHRF